MKKSLLTLAVVAGFASVAQAADTTTLYGRLAYEINIQDLKNADESTLDLSTSAVRLGVKGVEELNNGLKALYKLEFAYDFAKEAANKGRLREIRQANVALQGGFGTLTLGKQTNLYGALNGKADIFESVSGEFRAIPTRSAKAISLVSPAGPVTLGAAVVLDGSKELGSGSDSKNVTVYQAGAQYGVNGLEAAFVYTGVKGTPVKHYAASLGYSNDNFAAGFDYERVQKTSDYFALAGEFKSGSNTFRLGAEYLDPKAEKGVVRALLGYQYNLSKRTYTFVEGTYERDLETKNNGYSAVFGLRHDF